MKTMTFAIVSIVVGTLACGGSPKGPTTTLDGYAAALRNQDFESAYSMMSESYRRTHSKDDYVKEMRASKEATQETATLLSQHSDKEITATLRYGMGETLRLVIENGEWKILDNPANYYGQETPRDALRSFLRAFEQKRWDVMLKLVPNAYREKMDESTVEAQFAGTQADEIAEMMATLRVHVMEPIEEVVPNSALMPYGNGKVVRFILEDERWKIQDPG